MSINSEYENFSNLMSELIKVPHSEIKAKLDAEKAAKKRKKKRKMIDQPPPQGKAKP